MFEGMLGLTEVLIFVIGFSLIIQFLKLQRTRHRFPPGPTPLPIFGNLLLLDFKLQRETLAKLRSIYGDIYTLWMGTTPVVVLNGYKAVKDGLVSHSEETSGRPLTPFYRDLMGNKGVFLTSGHVWKQQKRFVMVTLRSLGVGRKGLEHRVQDAAQHLVRAFASKQGLAFDPQIPLMRASSNVICSLAFGHRYPSEDDTFNKLIKATALVIYVPATIWGRVYDAFPSLMPRLRGPHQQVFEYNDFMHNLVKDKLQSHKETWKEGDEPHDLIDFYLDQIAKSKDDPTSTFNEDNLIQSVVDLLIGGTETTATCLYWGLLYLLKHPEVQEKVHKEIDAVLGRYQTIHYEDRKKLPYTNAVLHEIVRFSNVTSTGPLRQCMKDTSVLGFPLEKGTLLLPNSHSVLYDPEYWETPWKFDPGHFLDSESNFVNNEAFLPYSAGRRACVGEPLARIELFIFFANLLQAFKYQLPEGVKEVNLADILGSTRQPYPYKVQALPR